MNYLLNDQMIAFHQLATSKSFVKAAKKLGITQSALTLRIKKLEDSLEKTICIRSNKGIELSKDGKHLFSLIDSVINFTKDYEQAKQEDGNNNLGSIAIGCYSTIGRSRVLPLLNNYLRENSNLEFNFMIKETNELIDLIDNSGVDIIFLDQKITSPYLEQILIGHEEFVRIGSKKHQKNNHVFLNHDENDMMSFRYFEKFNIEIKNLNIKYLDEIYSVIDGVVSGIGQSVIPKHLIEKNEQIKIIDPNKKMLTPIYLTYKKRSYYPKLFLKIKDLIIENFKI